MLPHLINTSYPNKGHYVKTLIPRKLSESLSIFDLFSQWQTQQNWVANESIVVVIKFILFVSVSFAVIGNLVPMKTLLNTDGYLTMLETCNKKGMLSQRPLKCHSKHDSTPSQQHHGS